MIETKETWRPIEGFPGYEVSNAGGVRSWRKNGPGGYRASEPRAVLPSTKNNGYLSVNLWCDGQRSSHSVHRLVLTAFAGPPAEEQVCRHLNGNQRDNAIGNLAWGTASDNMKDAVRHGTHPGLHYCGTKHYAAKLTPEQVREIRRLTANGNSRYKVADALGISAGNVSYVRYGGWKNVA